MTETAAKRLVITADTSSLPKAAAEVQKLGTETGKTSAILTAAKGSMPAAEYRALAASLAPAIAAEKALAVQAREVERALKPMVAEQRRATAEHLKADAVLQRRVLSEQKAANVLRMRHDVEYRNAQTMLKVQADVDRQVQLSNLTLEEGNNILAGASARYQRFGNGLKPVNDNIRLTSNQMLNLSRQGGDVATMFAMGASPMQIFASQTAQVIDALQSGPGGLAGSLKAVGSSIAGFARAIPAAGYAVAGLGVAVAGVYALTKGPAARSAEESVESFEDAVRSLEGAWSGAGDAAEEFYRRAQAQAASNPIDAMLDTQAQVRKLQDDYRAAVRALNFDDTLQERIIAPDFGGMSEARKQIRDLYAELMRGDIKATEMAESMRDIRMDPENEGYTRAFADAIRIALGNAIDLEARINAIGAATEGLSGKGARVFGGADQSAPWNLEDRFGGVSSLMDRFDPGSMDTIRDGLKAQAEELTKTDKAVDEYAKSLADMRSGWSETADDLRLQVELYGQSEGAIASARFEHEALAEARKLAADADKLFDETGADAMRIREVAAEVGNLTDQLKGMKEAENQAKKIRDVLADLQFQGSLIGLSDVEADVARQLNTLKLGHESLDGQRIAGQIRYNDSLQKTQDGLEKQRELMSNIVSTGFDALFDVGKSDTFFDSVMDGLADVGGQFTNDISALWKEDAR